MRINKRELSERLGVSEQTLTAWQRAGMPVLEHGRRGKPGTYDLGAVVRWVRSTGYGLGMHNRRGQAVVKIDALERELGLVPFPAIQASAPARFPDPRTIRAVELAMADSLVKACAIMVRVLNLPPGTALRCWEIATSEMASAFEDRNGFDTGPNRVTGDSRVLLQDDGYEVLSVRISEIATALPQGDLDVYEHLGPDGVTGNELAGA